MSQDIINLGCNKDKVSVHYHGVPDNLSSIERKFEPQKRLSLLMLSYLDPVKGHLFVLEALKALIDDGLKNFHLNIVGEGHFKDAIKQKIIELNLENYVSLLGKVFYLSKEYFDTFQNADIFLHPSVVTKEDKEGIPGSLVEAMFAALPVVATNHGGIPHIVENNVNGLLVKEWDTPALANAIRKYLLDIETRRSLGLAGRTFAINNLDLSKKEQELEKIYKSLMKQ
jgi:colanic acid/amylovoran biosynthesis glycosyltransferase